MENPSKQERAGSFWEEQLELGARAPIYSAAGLSLVAAMIHLWATPEHLSGWWAYGAFFLLVAVVQGLYAVWLLRLAEWRFVQPLFAAGIAGNLAMVLIYILTHTYGLPTFGVPTTAHSGDVEAVGALDMGATVAELGIVLALVVSLKSAYRKATINVLLLIGAVLWALRLAGILP